jgi:hypothetical protein
MKHGHTLAGRNVLAMMAAAAIVVQTGCRSLQTIPGQWLAFPDTGNRLEDFSKKITSNLFENGMMVGIGNDARFLYIFFSPDIRHQQRIPGRATLTLWLDEEGGKAKKLGMVIINSQLSSDKPSGEDRPEMNRDERAEPVKPQGPPPEGNGQFLLKVVDRRSGKETFINADGSLGPAVRLASDWGDFAYQLRVPIEPAANGDWPGLRLKPGKPIGIGLLWRIIPQPGFAKKDGPGHARGGPPAGGPGQGGGGQEMGSPPDMEGSGLGPGGGMPGQKSTTKRTFWLKTLLVNK